MSAPRQQTLQADSAVYLTVAHAADRANISSRTIKRWIKAGYLSAVRLPSPKGRGRLRIRVGELEALLARGTVR